MNNKGQALVEFVLILPIFLMILFVIVDFGMIFSTKIKVEVDSEDIIMLLSKGSSVSDINNKYYDIEISVSEYNNEFIKVKLKREVDIITPGLDRILGDPYEVIVERIISNEKA